MRLLLLVVVMVVMVRMKGPNISLRVPVSFFLPVAAPRPAVLLAPSVLRQVDHAVRPLLFSRTLSLSVPLSVPLPPVMPIPAPVPGRSLRGCGAGRRVCGCRRRVEGQLAQGGWQVKAL